MDAVAMQLAVSTRLRNVTQVNTGEFLQSSVIESFLNKSQDLTVRKYVELLDKEPQARLYLGKLIQGRKYTDAQITADTDTTSPTGILITIPADIRYPVLEYVKMTSTSGKIKRSRVKEITGTHQELNTENPFKKPYEDMVWRTEMGRNSGSGNNRYFQLILPTGYTFNEYYIDYVIHPASIVISSNTSSLLDEGTHNELVDLAVELIINTYQLRKTN